MGGVIKGYTKSILKIKKKVVHYLNNSLTENRKTLNIINYQKNRICNTSGASLVSLSSDLYALYVCLTTVCTSISIHCIIKKKWYVHSVIRIFILHRNIRVALKRSR